jgi:hypothetical protein
LKKKFLALTMASAIMLMGAGYAAWSDSTSLTSTVNTGKFDMQITDASLRTGSNQSQNQVHNWHKYDWTKSGTVSHTSSSVIASFDNLYPGGVVQVDSTTKNMGTVPAKLASVTVEYLDGNRNLFNLLRAQTSWKADITGDGTQDKYAHVEDFTTWRGLQDAMNQLVASTTSNNLVIEPKGWFALGDGTEDGCIQIKLDPGAGNEFQNQSCRFKITFNWDQWASDPNSNPYDANADSSKGDVLPGYGGDGDLQ